MSEPLFSAEPPIASSTPDASLGQAGNGGERLQPELPAETGRILLVDDTPAIHEDFRKILLEDEDVSIDETEAMLFGASPIQPRPIQLAVDSAYQGQEALQLVQEAMAQNKPYALAFVDIRMPPGWDGIETIARLWAIDPDLQVVVCTAYSDYSWADIVQRLGSTDSLVILKKPFDNIEVLQLAHALLKKWQLTQESKQRLQVLDSLVAQRTRDLQVANEKLSAFSSLGQRLSATKTVREAALAIVDVADHLLGWDACVCHLYSAEEDMLHHVLTIDVIEGKRSECAPLCLHGPPTPLTLRTIREGDRKSVV